MDYFLAIDMGASSGRCVLASLQHGKLVLEEIHRFSNGMVEREGHLCWDVDHLFAEIIAGLRACAAGWGEPACGAARRLSRQAHGPQLCND